MMPKSNGKNLRYFILCESKIMRRKANICVSMIALMGRDTFGHYYDEYLKRYTLRVYVNIVYRLSDRCYSYCFVSYVSYFNPVIVIYSVI